MPRSVLFVLFLALCALSQGASVLGDNQLELSKGAFYDPIDSNITGWVAPEKTKASRFMSEIKYEGKVECATTDKPGDLEDDYVLRLGSESCLHALTKKLDNPVKLDPKNGLVIQFEARFAEKFECGGGYLKFLNIPDDKSMIEEFDNEEYHSVIFGPDFCFEKSRTYFLIQHKQKDSKGITSQFNEYVDIGSSKEDFNLYTLFLKPDGRFAIMINGKEVIEADYTNFTPEVYIPKMIKDPNVKDPNADYKYFILDENEKKPDDWDDSQPEHIPDPSAQKPEDWNDEEELLVELPKEVQDFYIENWVDEFLPNFTPRMGLNPNCKNLKCGKWKAAIIKNPEYRGKWVPQHVPNPVPPVEWEHPMIENPDYVEGLNPNKDVLINAVSLDVWTTTPGIEFDNIYIGNSLDEADRIARKTFFKRHIGSLASPSVAAKKTGSNGEPNVFGRMLKDFRNSMKSYSKGHEDFTEKTFAKIEELKGSGKWTIVLSTFISTVTISIYFMAKYLGSKSSSRTKKKSKAVESKESSDTSDVDSNANEDSPNEDDELNESSGEAAEPAKSSKLESSVKRRKRGDQSSKSAK